MDDLDLHGRTALVTGGGRGIGRATALLLALHGARVVVSARSRDQIEAVASEIEELGGKATAVTADMADESSLHRLVEQAGHVDILINNAGTIEPITTVASADPRVWLRDIEINLYGVFLACHYALPGMLEAGWGRIVNVSSGAARGTTFGWSAYSSSKAGVEALTGVLSREVAGRGIQVIAVRPGIVDTAMQVTIRDSSEAGFSRENLDRFRGYKTQGKLRRPEDPARLIVWALSPEAERFNGQSIAIDDPEIAGRLGLETIAR